MPVVVLDISMVPMFPSPLSTFQRHAHNPHPRVSTRTVENSYHWNVSRKCFLVRIVFAPRSFSKLSRIQLSDSFVHEGQSINQPINQLSNTVDIIDHRPRELYLIAPICPSIPPLQDWSAHTPLQRNKDCPTNYVCLITTVLKNTFKE